MESIDRELNLDERVDQIEKYFNYDHYKEDVNKVVVALDNGDTDKVTELCETFPTLRDLLRDLLFKLRGKSIYKNLKKVISGSKDVTLERKLIGLSSLATHAFIEAEKGRREYIMIADYAYNVWGKIRLQKSKELFTGVI